MLLRAYERKAYIFQNANGSVNNSGVLMFTRDLECESGSYRIQWIS